MGALVGGSKDFIEEAWRLRKALGGGMRQAGVLAAAALVGLAEAEEVLPRDHENAQRFATGAWTSPRPAPFAPYHLGLDVPSSRTRSPADLHPQASSKLLGWDLGLLASAGPTPWATHIGMHPAESGQDSVEPPMWVFCAFSKFS